MAGQIRKGFFFYFGLFVLLLVAVFLVCLVVMIFNPNKTVLWMQYFTDNTSYHINKTTDTKEDIDWLNIEHLEINCTYANVIVERDNNAQYPKTEMIVKNNAKGFTAASTAVPFAVSVEFEESSEGFKKLVVNITEPAGFLFFSKNITVVLHASSVDEKLDNFSKLNLVVNTNEGDVQIGSSYNDTRTSGVVLNSLKVETGKGNVFFTNRFKPVNLKSCDLKTHSGDIKSAYVTSNKDLNGKTLTGLELLCDANLTTYNGKIEFENLSLNGKLDLTCKKGTVVIKNLRATDARFLACVEGNYIFGEVFCRLFFDSQDSLISPNITAEKIHGNFVLGTKAENGSAPKINIKEVDGALFVYSDKGTLNVSKASGDVEIISGDSLNANVGIADKNTKNIVVDNANGSVNLNFAGTVSGNVKVTTQNGNIVFGVVGSAKFVAYMWKNQESEKLPLPIDKIKVNIDGATEIKSNVLEINQDLTGANGHIEVFTNSSVEFNLMSA